MSTNRPASPFAASWRLLLPVVVGLVVLGSILFGVLHRQEANKAVTQDAPPEQATPGAVAIEEAKPSSPASSTVATAPRPSAPAVPLSAPAAPTEAGVQPTPPIAVATPPPSSQRPHLAAKDSSLIDPLSTEQALDPGEPARARVTVGGVQTPFLSPNQVGSFPRVYLPQGGQADVQVQLPEAQVGDKVVTAMEDGGTFANAKPVQALTVDENHQIAFQFQANQAQGTFRVSVHHNAQTKIVTFWAGERIALPNY